MCCLLFARDDHALCSFLFEHGQRYHYQRRPLALL